MAPSVSGFVMSQRIDIDVFSKTVHVGRRDLQILGRVACTIEAGSFASLIGPSGCGKSTLLRAIMGLDLDMEGRILIGDRLVSGPGLERGIVFQEPRLLPWASVSDNIAFAGRSAADFCAWRRRPEGSLACLVSLISPVHGPISSPAE